jgi:hypothetical protein
MGYLVLLGTIALFPGAAAAQQQCSGTALECAQAAQNAIGEARQEIEQLRQVMINQEQQNSAMRSRLQSLVTNAGQPGTDTATAPNRVHGASEASCPPGQYLVGIKLRWTGTCDNQCNGDGGILGGLTVVCRRL